MVPARAFRMFTLLFPLAMIDLTWGEKVKDGSRVTPRILGLLEWSLVGGPGCEQTYDDRKAEQRPYLVAPLLEYQLECLSGCDE